MIQIDAGHREIAARLGLAEVDGEAVLFYDVLRSRMAELDQRNRALRTGGRPAVSGNAYADMVGDQR